MPTPTGLVKFFIIHLFFVDRKTPQFTNEQMKRGIY